MSTVWSENVLDPPPLGSRLDQMNQAIDHNPGIPYIVLLSIKSRFYDQNLDVDLDLIQKSLVYYLDLARSGVWYDQD